MEKGGSQMSSREETQLEFYERLIRTHHKELLRLASKSILVWNNSLLWSSKTFCAGILLPPGTTMPAWH